MMRKTYLLMTVMAVFLWSCGEAGIQSDVSKTSEIDFAVTAADINAAAGSTEAVTFDFADEDFSSYVSDAQRFTLNTLEVEIKELVNTQATTIDIEIRIDLSNNTASSTDGSDLLTITNVPVANTNDPILLYSTDAGNPGLANASVVASLEQAILNGNAVEIEITTAKSGADITEDFTVNFLFDLTARLDFN